MSSRATLASTFVLLLTALAAGQTTNLLWTGSQNGQWYGASVALLGDTNGDYFGDCAIGSPFFSGATGPTGLVGVYGGPTGNLVINIAGEFPLDQFGAAVGALGDVNNDGRADLIVGAPGNNEGGLQSGKIYVASGSTGAILRTWVGTAGARLGTAVAGIDDVNGDGIPDVLCGAPGQSGNTGAVFLWSGATGALIRQWNGAAAGDQFGSSVANAGFVNADAIPDVVVGAPNHNPGVNLVDAGRADTFSGATGAVIHTIAGTVAGQLCGLSVAGTGDVNGDGRADIVIGLPLADFSSPDAGRALVISGATGAVLAAIDGQQPGEKLGRSVGCAGDRNGDGRPDLLIAAPSFTGPLGALQGRIRVVSGANFQDLATFVGDNPGDQLGDAVSGGPDFDGNGLPDVVFGAPRHTAVNAINIGRVSCFPAPGAVPYAVGIASGNLTTIGCAGPLTPGSSITLSGQSPITGAPGFLFVGPLPAYIPFTGPFGPAAILLDLSIPEALIPFSIFTDFLGSYAIPATLPASGSLSGRTFFLQAVASTSPASTSLSHGLQITCGY